MKIKIFFFGAFFSLLIFNSFFSSIVHVSCLPSGGIYPPKFIYRNGYWYDTWGFNRNFYAGDDGYLPNLAYETLGENRDLAFELGLEFKEKYIDKVDRATAILNFVQLWTEYGFDEDNVFRGGSAQEEWAWNADEMMNMLNTTLHLVATGDCEDVSFLCATIYLAAGYEVVLVEPPEHVALLIWLPEYPNANIYWDIPDDGKDFGWIWVEATGENNRVGWTPPEFSDGFWWVYPLIFFNFEVDFFPENPSVDDDVTVTASVNSTIGEIVEVKLSYNVDGGQFVDSSMIENIQEKPYFEGIIPRQPKGTRVKFYVTVSDSEGHVSERGDYEYVVDLDFMIPGFPIESILIGGFLLIMFFWYKRFHSASV
jgi:hypothetical protein